MSRRLRESFRPNCSLKPAINGLIEDSRTERVLRALEEALGESKKSVIWTAAYEDRATGEIIVRLRPAVTRENDDTAPVIMRVCNQLNYANPTLRISELQSALDGVDEIEVRLPSTIGVKQMSWHLTYKQWNLPLLGRVSIGGVVVSLIGLLAVAMGMLSEKKIAGLSGGT